MLSHNELVDILRSATDNVFTTMLGIEPVHQDSYTETSSSLSSSGMFTLIGFAGPWVGTGTLSCSVNLAFLLAGRLMLAEYDSVNDEVLDAMAEMTNMIHGNVKTALEERLGPMGLSIPTVIHGRNFKSRTIGTQEWSIAPFLIEGELLEVQICLAKNTERARTRPGVVGAPSVHI